MDSLTQEVLEFIALYSDEATRSSLLTVSSRTQVTVEKVAYNDRCQVDNGSFD